MGSMTLGMINGRVLLMEQFGTICPIDLYTHGEQVPLRLRRLLQVRSFCRLPAEAPDLMGSPLAATAICT